MRKKSSKSRALSLLLPVLLACAAAIPFVVLYRMSNPLFSHFLGEFDLSWIDAGWWLFTLLGLFLVYGLLRARPISWLVPLEQKLTASPRANDEEGGNESIVARAGLLFLGILNILLLIMNGLDLRQILFRRSLPEGITLSAFVHEAVAANFFAVIFVVSISMVLFRGQLIFSQAGKRVKIMLNLWVAQTAAVLVSTAVRNIWYIQAYQLTHARIAVFIFLILALVLLSLTCYKVAQVKSAWWLVTSNARVWYITLVIVACTPWNTLITSFNIDQSRATGHLDRDFLLSMGESNLPQLIQLHKTDPFTGEQLEKLQKRVLWEKREIEEVQPFGKGWPGYSLRFERNRAAITEFMKLESERP